MGENNSETEYPMLDLLTCKEVNSLRESHGQSQQEQTNINSKTLEIQEKRYFIISIFSNEGDKFSYPLSLPFFTRVPHPNEIRSYESLQHHSQNKVITAKIPTPVLLTDDEYEKSEEKENFATAPMPPENRDLQTENIKYQA